MGIPRFKLASNYLVALLTLERTHPFSVFNVVSASDGDIGDEDLRDAYTGAIIEAFEGRNPAVRAIAEQIIADRGHGFTDPVSAALMTDLGWTRSCRSRWQWSTSTASRSTAHPPTASPSA